MGEAKRRQAAGYVPAVTTRPKIKDSVLVWGAGEPLMTFADCMAAELAGTASLRVMGAFEIVDRAVKAASAAIENGMGHRRQNCIATTKILVTLLQEAGLDAVALFGSSAYKVGDGPLDSIVYDGALGDNSFHAWAAIRLDDGGIIHIDPATSTFVEISELYAATEMPLNVTWDAPEALIFYTPADFDFWEIWKRGLDRSAGAWMYRPSNDADSFAAKELTRREPSLDMMLTGAQCLMRGGSIYSIKNPGGVSIGAMVGA